MQTSLAADTQGRIRRQVKGGIDLPRENTMPIGKYDSAFGGKAGSAAKAMRSMQKSYGPKKGERVFYATKNKRSPLAAMQRKK